MTLVLIVQKQRVKVLVTSYNELRQCHQRPKSPCSSVPYTQTGEKKIPFKDAISQTVEYKVWISAVVTQEESWRTSAAYSGVGIAQPKTVWVTS